MSNIRVAKRYAKGLFQFTQEKGNPTDTYKEMQSLSELITESKDLRSFLKSPILDYKKKQEIASKLFDSYSSSTRNFIQLVIQHRREANLQQITNAYIELSDVQNHVKKAILTTATEISDALAQKIVDDSKLISTSDTLQLTKEINPELIGGYIFKVGDQQIDASVKSKFNKLKQEFDDNHYIPKY